MAESQSMTSAGVVAKALIDEHSDFLRESVAMIAAQLMEAEIERQIGAGRGETRATHRNGYRPRPWATRVGEIELAVPRKRSGESYFPSFLEPRKRSEKALLGAVMEAYVNGVSTRKVDHLVSELGIHMSKDQVSRICGELDGQVEAFRTRPLEGGAYPYLWLDAKHLKVRDRGHVHSKALMVAFAVHESGRREVIGIEIAESETEAGWAAFLRELVARGLEGVRLAVSDDHLGLKAAIAKVIGCPLADARERSASVVERLAPTVPKVATLLTEAEEDLLAFYRFPSAHWPKLRSTNSIERVNKEIARRSDVSTLTWMLSRCESGWRFIDSLPARDEEARHQAVSTGLPGGGADGAGALRSQPGAPRREGVSGRAGSHELWRPVGLAATMEATLMATVVALDSSPANVLRSMRGPIVEARTAYPDVLHVEVRDSAGELWRLATQDADWSPTDPAELVGKSIEGAEIDEETGELRCRLSGGALLDVKPAAQEASDDPPNWELITPGGVLLEFGPGVRWQISSATDPVSARR